MELFSWMEGSWESLSTDGLPCLFVAFLSSLLEPLMLPILRKAEEMRHLCDEAVDEAPPSLLVRCIVPLIYRLLRRRRDVRRGEARRIEGRGRIFSCWGEASRNGPKWTGRVEGEASRGEEAGE